MENSENPVVKVNKGGPYLLKGTFTLILPSGDEQTVTDPHLCRCGGSNNKPFCDGSHTKSNLDK